MSGLVFQDVWVRYGHFTAVAGVSLEVPRGQVVGLVGGSGSGKSTLAKAALGLAPLTSGAIALDGQPVGRGGRAGRLQLVFQDPYSSLDPRMRVAETVAEALPPGADRAAETARLLELVRLAPGAARAFPSRLSGGERQRVAIARALASRPEVLIADEITSALDVSTQGAVLNLVRDLRRRLGLTMLFISHNLAVLRYVAERIAVMKDGRLVEQGPAAQLLARPAHPYTQELLAAVPGRHLKWNGEPT
ncbi:MAG: ATP-binding cassette domain-containing protein [Bifidobacteriaceae bacterium]|jgi:peptide/nickel transport system ATP-binding protein|nr:ATP-binding cassette domain-containing protein [Bifidobacteriaceae bacterium]